MILACGYNVATRPRQRTLSGILSMTPLGVAANLAQPLEMAARATPDDGFLPAEFGAVPSLGGPKSPYIRPMCRSSPAPDTREWLAAICSTRLVPERGHSDDEDWTFDRMPNR